VVGVTTIVCLSQIVPSPDRLPTTKKLGVNILGTLAIQAALSIHGAAGPCKLQLSERPDFSTNHPDVDGSQYPGADIDTQRDDTITWADGTRIITLGHPQFNRALAAATTYYVRVSCSHAVGSHSFTTETIPSGSTWSPPVPFDASSPWHFAYPRLDLLSRQSIVDPTTGVRLMPINVATDWGWRTGGAPDNPNGTAGNYTPFTNWSGGAGWSEPANVLNHATSNATTNNIYPIDLYGVYTRFAGGAADNPFGSTYDDLGLVLWGSASDRHDRNNAISACIILNPLDSCIGTPLIISLPGSFSQLKSGSADPDNAFPSSFPTPFFAGWGLSEPLGPDRVNTQGILRASNGVLVIPSPTSSSFFQPTLKAGNKIWIKGSAAQGCQNDLCTVSSYRNSSQVMVAENVTFAQDTPYIAFSWGVRICKVTNIGSITLGAAYKQAGSIAPQQIGAANPMFNPHSFVSGDGHTGYLVAVPSGGLGFLYFVSGDGTVRPLWAGHKSPSHSCYSPNTPADLPEGLGFQAGPPFSFDPVDPKTFYIAGRTASGETSIWKVLFTGDATQSANSNYAFSQSGDQFTMNPPCDNLRWTNLMVGKYLTVQTAHWPGYNAALYGNTWLFTGISGHYAYFVNSYSGQDGGPGWVAVVDVSNGTLTNMIHTIDGTGTGGKISWGAIHSALAAYPPNTATISSNLLARSEASRLYGGPFQATILAIKRGGVWKPDTSLPWPVDNSYDNQCPVGNPFEALGATGSSCVTLQMPPGGVCNARPRADEKPACPWNAQYSQPFTLKVGDVFTDMGLFVDTEHFRVVDIKTNSDNTLTVVAQRNAMWDYCCVSPSVHGGVDNCVAGPQDNRHASGWTIIMNPAHTNDCASGAFHYDPTTGQIGEAGRYFIGGHYTIGPGLSPDKLTIVAVSGGGGFYGSRFNRTFSELYSLPTTFFHLAYPAFNGLVSPIGGGVQAYPEIHGSVMWDANTVNNSNGSYQLARRTLTPTETADVYKIQVIGTLSPKLMPLFGWAGRYLLHDVSGPNSYVDSEPWSMCYALVKGECHSGSAAGETYVNVPGAWDDGNCLTGQSWLTSPCVLSGWPSAGGFRQQAIDADDKAGARSRLLTYGLTAPGKHAPFTGVAVAPDGTFALVSPQQVQGWGSVLFLVQAPPWKEPGGVSRNQLVGVPVEIPAGPRYAEIQFGYSRFGSPASFQCTARSEACNTSGSPYAFESEPRTLTDCANGCTVSIPATPGNLLYFRVRRSPDGSQWTNASDDIQVRAVP
jgi:hypothetical protein